VSVSVLRAAVLATVLMVGNACQSTQGIDLAADPHSVTATPAFAVGERFTVGMTHPDQDSPRPLRVTSVEVLNAVGLEQVGVGVVNGARVGVNVGILAGWPPDGYAVDATGDAAYEREWDQPIYTIVGAEVTAATSGLRGIEVGWVDADGKSHTRVFDIAVVNCPAGACETEAQQQQTLRDLGLITRR
jgi:hypothetical protein